MRVFAAPRRKLDEFEVEVASHKETARTPKRCSCHFLMVGAMRSKLKTEGYESIISSSSNQINHGEIISLSLEAGVA